MPTTKQIADWFAGLGPQAKQSLIDAQRQIQNLSSPTLPTISSNTADIMKGLFGNSNPSHLANMQGAFGMVGTLGQVLQGTEEVKEAVTNPTTGIPSLATDIAGIQAWIDGASEPLGYFEVGKLSIADAMADIWSAPIPGHTGYNSGSLMVNAGAVAGIDSALGLHRQVNAPLFLVHWDGEETIDNPAREIDLSGVNPALQNPGESDLDFLMRVKPGMSWITNVLGTIFPGHVELSPGGTPVTYIYVPHISSPWAFKRMWDYTPSSGPPMRNAIDDFIGVLSLLPLQF